MLAATAVGEALRVVRAPVLVVRLELVAQQVIVHHMPQLVVEGVALATQRPVADVDVELG